MAVDKKKWTPYSASVGGTSIEILPANTLRKFASISNPTAVGMWIAFGQDAVVGQGEYIAPGGGSYVIDGDNMWRGAVNVVAASGSGNVIGAGDWQ